MGWVGPLAAGCASMHSKYSKAYWQPRRNRRPKEDGQCSEKHEGEYGWLERIRLLGSLVRPQVHAATGDRCAGLVSTVRITTSSCAEKSPGLSSVCLLILVWRLSSSLLLFSYS